MDREIIFLSGLGVNVMVSSMLRIGLKVFLAMAETRTFSVHDELEVSVLIVMMVVEWMFLVPCPLSLLYQEVGAKLEARPDWIAPYTTPRLLFL